jgi:cellulose synthase/poly-beta-1,6-N-acetylglucosamine synthase-like glycosyltransferase
MKKKRRSVFFRVAILIPAFNEAKVIGGTIKALKRFKPGRDIYVVDDGSTDGTTGIARKLLPRTNVVKLKNGGKVRAINQGVKRFKLLKRYNYLMPIDADTVVEKGFFPNVRKMMQADKEGKIVAVVGRVRGRANNWLTGYRMWEYEVSQAIHKRAQDVMRAILVCPGCSTVFRTRLWSEMQLPIGTQTEDMDHTWQIYRKGLGQVVYCDRAVVITQDPRTVRDYVKQIKRWYVGFWQCLIKHEVPWGGQMLDFEVSLQAVEGLYYGLLAWLTLIGWPLIGLTGKWWILTVPWAIDLGLFLVPTLGYASWRLRTLRLWKYFPVFYGLRILSSMMFLWAFGKVWLWGDRKLSLSWDTQRY